MTYLSQIVVIVCLYGMYAISLNLVLGYGGMLSLCQISLVGVGAYIYAGITSWVSLTFIPATALSIIGGVFAAALVAAATSRLRGDYFALSTISLLVFFQFVFLRWTDATGGAFGRRGISPPTIGTLQVNSPQAYALLMVLSLSIVLALCAFLTRGARGRSLKALRDDELAAVSLGYNPIILRTSILLLSGGVAGFAGALLASYTGYIDS
ncbi:MAG: branched-chain amino acid ABC transporter permease, partial [Candidatus Solibacter sp.]|nr:branched-chain amino acid ABC transporter permease [Candidatus Solibacter sp.]